MTFRELHYADLPLVLPNAWDVASALALRDAGFPALGTTSFGVAASHGVPDGGRSTRDDNVALAAALHPLGCYLSLDIEDGYSSDPDEVADYVGRLPVDGINIEDSTAEALIEPEVHMAKIAAIKAQSPGMFVNARVDTYWLGERAEVGETLARAALYVEAGADGVFVPGVTEPDVVRALAAAIDRPLNVLPIPGHSPAALAELGVRRVSCGSLPYRAAMHAAVRAATAVRDGLTFPDATPYADMQASLVGYTNDR